MSEKLGKWEKQLDHSFHIPKKERFWWMSPMMDNSPPCPLWVETIGFSYWDAKRIIKRSHNPVFGIEIVTSGKMIFEQNGREWIVEPGSLFIKQCGSSVNYRTGGTGFATKRYIRLTGPLLPFYLRELALDNADVINLPSEHVFEIKNYFKTFTSIARTRPSDFVEKLSQQAYLFLFKLAKIHHNEITPHPLQPVTEYLRANLDKTLKEKVVAQKFAYSVSQMNRLFRKHYSMPLMKYFQNEKYKLARKLLLETEAPIHQISSRLAMEDPFYFSTWFKRHSGLSPREFRKRERGVE